MFKPMVEAEHALHLRVANEIKNAIREGKLKSSERLPTERQLAEDLGVSRTVVRDALKLLSGEGLIDVRHGIGIFVAAPDDRRFLANMAMLLTLHEGTVRQLFEVRRMLEGEAAALAALRATPEQRAELSRLIRLYWQQLKTGTLGYEEANQIDLAVHHLIAEATGNDVLLKVMETLGELMISSRERSIRIPGRLSELAEEMGAVVDAILAENVAEARRLMLLHLDNGGAAALRAVE